MGALTALQRVEQYDIFQRRPERFSKSCAQHTHHDVGYALAQSLATCDERNFSHWRRTRKRPQLGSAPRGCELVRDQRRQNRRTKTCVY